MLQNFTWVPDWVAGEWHSEGVQTGKQSFIGGATFQLTQKLLRRNLTAAPQTTLSENNGEKILLDGHKHCQTVDFCFFSQFK